MPFDIVNDCLYNTNDPKIFITPAGDESTDVMFGAPGRWPLFMTIAGSDNRGRPISHGSEGSGVFMNAPNGIIPYCTPNDNSSSDVNSSKTGNSKASAAIFAGAISLIKSTRPDLTLADLFFITAMTATINYNDSTLWDKNGFGLLFSRRSGFGRLRLGAALFQLESWKSVGNIINFSSTYTFEKRLVGNDIFNFTFVTPKRHSIISLRLSFTALDLTFGSLVPIITSPMNTTSELKILTEAAFGNDDIKFVELPCTLR